MLLLAFRSFFFIAVLLGYSTGIWRLINDYFRREFQSYLTEEVKTNKYLLQDPPTTTTTSSPPAPPLEETIVRVGRVLVARTDGHHPAEEVEGARILATSSSSSSSSSSDEQEMDEEARWLHYWQQQQQQRNSGKAKEFAEQEDVCAAPRETVEETANSNVKCPG